MSYNIYDYISCKYGLGDDGKYVDISKSSSYIANSIIKKDEVYKYNILYHDYDNFLTNEDKQIFEEAMKKWSEMILVRVLPEYEYDMIISVYVETNSPNILASAACTSTANGIPVTGAVWINTANWREQVAHKKEDGTNQAYYSVLHELGHVFGIGTVWSHLVENNFYFGENAVREYRNLLGDQNLKGVPVEDDGGGGTSGTHIEEGAEYTISDDHRYNDGHLHVGLDRELMTGWAESDDGVEPLSRVSVGFLNDLGFAMNYKKADPYIYSNEGILNKGEILTINGEQIAIEKNMDYLQYDVPLTSGNELIVSSNGKSIAYVMYYRFQGDTSYYKDSLRLNSISNEVSEIEITPEPKSMYIHTGYQGLRTERILIFFRNR